MADMGVSKCLDNSPILDLQGHRKIADSLNARFTERIYNPFMADIIHDWLARYRLSDILKGIKFNYLFDKNFIFQANLKSRIDWYGGG